MSTSGGPNIVRDGLIFYIDAVNEKKYKYKQRLYDYGVWSEGGSGNVGDFSDYANEHHNLRVKKIDPWGNDSIVWMSYSGTTYDSSFPSEGGIYCNSKTIDNTKLYRLSYWENRVSNGSSPTYGRYYFGCNGYGSVNGVKRVDNDLTTTNPYFWSTNHDNLTENLWFLVVGHIFPHDYNNTDFHEDSGRYTLNGGRIGNISDDYKWLPETTRARPRTLAVYHGDDVGMYHYSMYPRMDLCDGTEPSIDDLLNGETIKDFSNDYVGYLVNGPKFSDNYIDFNGINEYCIFNDNFLNNPIELTISVWFSRDGDGGTYECVLHKGSDDTIGNSEYWVGVSSDGYLTSTIGARTGVGWSAGKTTTSCINGNWYNLVASWDGSVVRIYINGQYDKQYNLGTYSNLSTPTRLSSSDNGNNYQFNGKVSNVKIYNRSLSETEIKINFNSLKSRYGI